MILTPEEAKTKWCPMARLAGKDGACNRAEVLEDKGPNLMAYLPRSTLCVADACMWWRSVITLDSVEQRGTCGATA